MFHRITAFALLALIGWPAGFAAAQFTFPQNPPPAGIRVQQQTLDQPRQRPPAGPSLQELLRMLTPPAAPPPVSSAPPRRRQATPPPEPPVPTAAQAAQMSPLEQRRVLRQALQSLSDDLDGMSTGAEWHAHLLLESLGAQLWTVSGPEPDARDRAALRSVAARFDEIAAEGAYRAIQRLWGFRVIRAVLGEYATEPAQRTLRTVRRQAASLGRALGRVRNGAGWQQHLGIQQIAGIAASRDEPAPADREVLKMLAKRFAAVGKNPDYAAIARMDGFDGANRNLQQLADQIVELEQPPDDEDAVDEALKSIVLDLRKIKQACENESKAQKALATLTLGSPEADAAGKKVLASKRLHAASMQDARDQIDKIKRLFDQAIAKKNARDKRIRQIVQALYGDDKDPMGTVKLLPLDDSEEPAPIMLLPLDDDVPEAEPVELLPLEDDVEPEDVVLLPLDSGTGTDDDSGNGNDDDDSDDDSDDKTDNGLAKLQMVVRALAAGPKRPRLGQQQSQALDATVAAIRGGRMQAAESTWREFVAGVHRNGVPLPVGSTIRTVLRETYAPLLNDAAAAANKAHAYGRLARTLSRHLEQLRAARGDLGADATIQIETIDHWPGYRRGQPMYTIWTERKLDPAELDAYINQLEEQLSRVGDDARLADVDLQQHLQKMQQLMQTMSKVSKMLNDTAMAVIRKTGS